MSYALQVLLVLPLTVAAGDFMDGVRPFMSFIPDAAVVEGVYGEGQFQYADAEGGSSILLGVQGATRVMPLMELGGRFGFASSDPDQGEGESGLVDPDAYVRYTVMEGARTRLAVGGFLNLPVGSEDLGEGTFDFGAFGALRYALTKGVILGHFGLRMNEGLEVEVPWVGTVEVDRETQILLGGGILYPLNSATTLTGEFTFASEEFEGGDSAIQLTPGVDARLASGLKVRGALALGLSDGAPDLVLMAGVAKVF